MERLALIVLRLAKEIYKLENNTKYSENKLT